MSSLKNPNAPCLTCKHAPHVAHIRNVCEERLARAERERDEAREEMKEAAGELLVPLPQSDPTVRKLLLANSIMRQERDAARADLERAQAEAARLRELLDQWGEDPDA